jgi:hypothetical protein
MRRCGAIVQLGDARVQVEFSMPVAFSMPSIIFAGAKNTTLKAPDRRRSLGLRLMYKPRALALDFVPTIPIGRKHRNSMVTLNTLLQQPQGLLSDRLAR